MRKIKRALYPSSWIACNAADRAVIYGGKERFEMIVIKSKARNNI